MCCFPARSLPSTRLLQSWCPVSLGLVVYVSENHQGRRAAKYDGVSPEPNVHRGPLREKRMLDHEFYAVV